jgi:hypothetical protein
MITLIIIIYIKISVVVEGKDLSDRGIDKSNPYSIIRTYSVPLLQNTNP